MKNIYLMKEKYFNPKHPLIYIVGCLQEITLDFNKFGYR